jgi:hypothetical protein
MEAFQRSPDLLVPDGVMFQRGDVNTHCSQKDCAGARTAFQYWPTKARDPLQKAWLGCESRVIPSLK